MANLVLYSRNGGGPAVIIYLPSDKENRSRLRRNKDGKTESMPSYNPKVTIIFSKNEMKIKKQKMSMKKGRDWLRDSPRVAQNTERESPVVGKLLLEGALETG